MKLKKIKLKESEILSKERMKKVVGGDAIQVLCYVGTYCTQTIEKGLKVSGTCQGIIVSGGVSCFCSTPYTSNPTESFNTSCTKQ